MGILAGAGAVGTSVLSGCGLARPGGAEEGLRYLSEDTADVEVAWYDKVNAAFRRAHSDVEVSGEYLSTAEDFWPKLRTQLAAHNPPDFVPRSGASRTYTLWSQGVLDPVDSIIEDIGPEKFDEGILSSFRVRDQYIGVPFVSITEALWYRRDLAEEAGLEPPTNWDELLTFARELTMDTNGDGRPDVYGITIPFGRNAATNRMLFCFIRQNGGNIVDPDLTVVFDSPAVVEALQFMQELAQYSPPGGANYAYAEQLNTFVTGKSAATYYWGRTLQAVNEQNPSLADKIGAVQMPYAKEPFNYAEPSGAYVFKEAKHKELARDYISNFQFDPKLYLSWITILPGHNLPTIPSVTESEAYRSNPLVGKYPEIIELLQAELAHGGFFSKESPDHRLNTQGGVLDSGTILADVVQRVLVDNESPKSAVAWGAKQITELMKDAVPL